MRPLHYAALHLLAGVCLGAPRVTESVFDLDVDDPWESLTRADSSLESDFLCDSAGIEDQHLLSDEEDALLADDSYPANNLIFQDPHQVPIIRPSSPFYPLAESKVSVQIRGIPKGKAKKVILETPDLGQWNLSVTARAPNCPETKPGSTKLRCQWDSYYYTRWTQFTLQLGEYSDSKIDIPITLKTYVGDTVDTTKGRIQWTVRHPKAYKQTEPDKFPQPRTLVVNALPSAESEKKRLRQWFNWADFQPTGFYLNPNTPLKVLCSSQHKSGPQPQLLIGTPALGDPDSDRESRPNSLEELPPLKGGLNIVSSPIGGIIYVRYTSDSDTWPRPDFIHLSGDAAQPIPFFIEGQTTERQWKQMLDLTTKYADKGQDQQSLLDTHAEIIYAQNKMSGLSFDASDPRDRASELRPMVVETKRGNPNAYTYRAAMPPTYDDSIWWVPRVRTSWGMWHEYGHQRQHVPTWSWSGLAEVTVNIYSLAAMRHFDPNAHQDVKYWNEAKKYLAEPDSKKDFDNGAFEGYNKLYVKLVMFEQLRVVFGDPFYHRLHQVSRRTSDQPQADRKHFFMTTASEVTEVDLSEYFIKWGLKPEKRSLDSMKKHRKPSEDYTKRPVFGGE
ncbi:hypothetical protein ASPWEDRAFT_57412 [Aspergillus wentii DTO 134E9]|uniref:Peptidase M60 domain-containing protein n=1 Tax=Aspergillus wentii DTO 134E9 TaxID=1073089 RepID=A0A1L9RV61_ASPWE|nr:uncharacterized protein ASPWEDRAFT_57412 [Aspergillus wentii DTO 134E9]OJJ38809.1 hypothetical protein ASPWEDRAFT_57412 [Aspergillus wentii DTO 134E9]